MRVSKVKAEENRNALLQAASKLFRRRGLDGVGVADVAKEAGLTHGALYAHFPSKDALAAEAFSHGFNANMAGMTAWAENRSLSFEDHLSALFSEGMRDRMETGCPMAASASETARQSRSIRASFARAFEEMVVVVEKSIEEEIPILQRRRLAVASVAAQIGAIAVSRAVKRIDAALADEVLDSVRKTIDAAYKVEAANFG